MVRKLNMLLASIAVAAFATPAFADAATEVTAGGEKAPIGTFIVAESENTVVKTSIGNLTCTTVDIHMELTTNNGFLFAMDDTGPFWAGSCFFRGAIPIVIDDGTLPSFPDGLYSLGPNSGFASLTFIATLPKELTCHYQGESVPFTYTSGGNTLSIAGPLEATPKACGTASFEGTYELSSPFGEAIVVH